MRSIAYSSIVVLFFASIYPAEAQHSLAIMLDPQTEKVSVDDLMLDSNVTQEAILKTMGKPSKTVDHPSGEVSLFYETAGIVFFTMDNKVKGLGINFNSDGDKKFPATSLNGKLTIGETEITKESKQEDLLKIEEIEFVCPFALLCASSNRDSKTRTTVSFKDGTLTQLVFLMNDK